MGRKLLTVALLSAALASVVALPAAAQTVPVTFSGPVTAGEALTLTCPEGHQVQLDAGQPNAAATFYKAANRVRSVGTFAPTSSTSTLVSWLIPKGARYADATLTCEPIPPPDPVTVTQTGVFDGVGVAVFCPEAAPYFVSAVVYGDSDGFATEQGRYLVAFDVLNFEDPDRIAFIGPLGHHYEAYLTCTSVPPAA